MKKIYMSVFAITRLLERVCHLGNLGNEKGSGEEGLESANNGTDVIRPQTLVYMIIHFTC